MCIERHAEGNYKTKHAETRNPPGFYYTSIHIHTYRERERLRDRAREGRRGRGWRTGMQLEYSRCHRPLTHADVCSYVCVCL